jgi:hypothetical protein
MGIAGLKSANFTVYIIDFWLLLTDTNHITIEFIGANLDSDRQKRVIRGEIMAFYRLLVETWECEIQECKYNEKSLSKHI